MSSVHERYTHGHHESVLRTHSWRTAENSAGYLLAHLREGDRVLDVGSGPGTITLDLARLVGSGSVLGIDMGEDVTAGAARLAAEQGVENVAFAVGDAYAIDAPDDTFDVVHAHQVLQHLGDPERALREFRRVTKPGGLLAARDVIYGAASWAPASDGLDTWMRVYQALARSNGGDPDAGRLLKGLAMATGWDVVASTASIWCFADDAERQWWGGAWADRALESSFAVQAVESGVAARAELEEISAAWSGWAADPTGWYAMPHGEILARKPGGSAG